jgi:hypothetical protein
MLRSVLGVYDYIAYRDKKVVGVFVAFFVRAPLQQSQLR